jgi:hypothetical protein
MLRPTVRRPVSLGIEHLSGAYEQIFVTIRQLRVCWWGALSLTRGQVCRWQLLLTFASAVILRSESPGTRNHILLSQIRDLPFRRLLRLTRLRWRYSTSPPYGDLSSVAFSLLLVSFLPEVGFGSTVWRSPSTVELSCSSLLLCFGGSLPCARKRVCMRCTGIDVTLYAMHCFFSRIRFCGNVFQQFAVQMRSLPCCHSNVLREAPPSRWAYCSFQASCQNSNIQHSSHVSQHHISSEDEAASLMALRQLVLQVSLFHSFIGGSGALCWTLASSSVP